MSLFDYISEDEKKLIQKKAMPTFVKPMLATLTHERFSDKNWLFERKLDGERCLLFKKGNKVILKSRNDKEANESYPEIVDLISSLVIPSCILDGEVVAFNKKKTSFSLLQQRFGIVSTDKARSLKIPVYYYVFDILYCDGYLLTHLPLTTRKRILKSMIPFQGLLRYVTDKKEKGELYFKQACKDGWEGLIAKEKDSPYLSKRSPLWLKFKCSNEQEFVIGGYTESTSPIMPFGALLLGYYKNNTLQYAGKVGTGFDTEMRNNLGALLQKNERKTNPFHNFNDSINGVHWVKPLLVCEVQFTEWTTGGKLRHPSYLGLRRDKKAREVVRE